jgi:hypothetical protein
VGEPLLAKPWLHVERVGLALPDQPRHDRLTDRFALRGVLFLVIAELIVLVSAGVPVFVSR